MASENLEIEEIVIGLPDGRAVTIGPMSPGINAIPIADAASVSAAVRETLGKAKRSETTALIPFVRIRARRAGLELTVADDASSKIRTLEIGVDGRIPTFVEASTEHDQDDAKLELIAARIAAAMDVARPEEIDPLLACMTEITPSDQESELERAYKRAEQRAMGLTQRVRGIDDQMTASVVPGWLFIAGGFGGVGVLMTVVTFYSPELRLIIVPAMIVLLVVGLGLYAWRSLHELKTRAMLQENRAQLRADREMARKDASRFASELKNRGIDPGRVLAEMAESARSMVGPLIAVQSTFDIASFRTPRQVLVFCSDVSVEGGHVVQVRTTAAAEVA